MSAHESLSPMQFVQQHVAFDNWAKNEQTRIRGEHKDSGAQRYTPEAGRRLSQLQGARQWLEDNYSQSAHDSFGNSRSQREILPEVGVPLHEAMDDRYHHLVDEHLETRGNR